MVFAFSKGLTFATDLLASLSKYLRANILTIPCVWLTATKHLIAEGCLNMRLVGFLVMIMVVGHGFGQNCSIRTRGLFWRQAQNTTSCKQIAHGAAPARHAVCKGAEQKPTDNKRKKAEQKNRYWRCWQLRSRQIWRAWMLIGCSSCGGRFFFCNTIILD